MNVLVLSPYPDKIADTLKIAGDEIEVTQYPISGIQSADFIVSYGYRHMISEKIVTAFKGRAVNLHISYLPWNRGADPNFWSWVQDTPKGVTIHEIGPGMDDGDIIFQREVAFGDDETLATSYEKLRRDIEALFSETWPKIRNGYIARKQPKGPCANRLRDKAPLFNHLPDKWNTKVSYLRELRDFI